MKYKIQKIDEYDEPYWKEGFEGKRVNYSHSESYETIDDDVAKDVIHNMLDVCDYGLDEKNIRENIGNVDSGCISQIIGYYTFRKELFEKIMKWMSSHGSNKSGWVVADKMSWEIPYEFNHFECDGSEPSDIRQKRCSITVSVDI